MKIIIHPKLKLFLPILSAWLIAFSLGAYFRLYPLIRFTPAQTDNQSEQYVHNQIRQKIARDVELKYPALPPEGKKALSDKLFQNILEQDARQLQETIKKVKHTIDGPYSENRNFPYLLASDSYYYFHITDEINRLGYFPYKIKGSKYHHALMMAPLGHDEPFNLHPYVGYYLFRFLKIFNPDIPLMQAVSYTPLLLSAAALLAFFWVGLLLNCRLSTVFVGAVFFMLAPIFVKRSTLGWYDNDPYNLIFPLLIIGCIFKGLTKEITHKTRLIYISLSFLLMWLYTYFWQGWMMFFCIILLSGLTIVLYNHFLLRNKKETQILAVSFLLFCGGSFLAVAVTFGPKEFIILFQEGWKALGDFLNPQLALWPDLYMSVGELRPSTWAYILDFTGGHFLFFTAVTGLICSIYYAAVSPKKQNPFYVITLGAFFFAALILTKGAQRFAILCLIPFSLFFILGLEYYLKGLTGLTNSLFKDKNRALNHLLPYIMIGLIFIPIRHINTSIKTLLNPIFNVAWEDALLKIKERTPPESIINTWWPPGHFIKAIAQRRVTFDGASINYPQAYWMSYLLLLSDEKEALGILRMLNNSGNEAAEYLTKLGIKLSTAVLIIKEITALPPREAADLLSRKFSSDQINTLLNLTHKPPPPSYIFLYNQFIAGNLQLGLLGRWNFAEIENINTRPEEINNIPKKNTKEYIQFLWKLVGGPLKYSGPLSIRRRNGSEIIFDENVTVDLNQMSCRVDSKQYGHGVPLSLFYPDDQGNIVEQRQTNSTLSFSAFLYKEGEFYKAILMDRALAQSLLMRLYFYNGAGLKHIKPFIHETDAKSNTEIKVLEVNWE